MVLFPLLQYSKICETVPGLIFLDPYDRHAISYNELVKCGHSQGLNVRPASQGGDIQIRDILFVRAGFVEAYNLKPHG